MRRNPDPPDGLISLRTAAELCGCATDPRLIPDLVAMRLVDDVVVVIRGKRFVRVADVDYLKGWVEWWAIRPMRPKGKSRGRKKR